MKKSIFIVFLLVIGCSDTYEKIDATYIKPMPEPIELVGEKIETEENELYRLFYLDFIDSNLVVTTANENMLIGIYDRNGKFRTRFGRIGKGPNEFNDLVEIYDFHREEDLIATNVDVNLLTLDKINLSKSIENENPYMENSYEFPRELRRISRAFYIDSTKIIGVYSGHYYKNLDQRTGLFDFDPSANKFNYYRLPNLDFRPSDPTDIAYRQNMSTLNSRHIDLSPSNNKLAIAMRYSPLLQIYEVGDKNFELRKSSYMQEENTGPEYEMVLFEQWAYPEFFHDITVTDDYIYLLKNAKYLLDEEEKEVHVQVLDWEGEPVKVFSLGSEYDIDRFTVNQGDSIIFGMSYSRDALFKFSYGNSK
ncbi:MAG: hypothetical protein ED557_13465 [Balneola sp.]|nr:MAG: hypothetical protein ED557_13465 [Balneola sp.]